LKEILNILIGSVTATVIAIVVNRLFEIRDKKPSIVFSLDCFYDVENIETKPDYYNSGYKIVCYNIGKVPVFITSIEIFRLFHKKGLFINIIPTQKKENKSLLPFKTMKYNLSLIEIDNLIKFCKSNNYEKLNVIAYGVDNKKYKGYINLWWIKSIGDEVIENKNS